MLRYLIGNRKVRKQCGETGAAQFPVHAGVIEIDDVIAEQCVVCLAHDRFGCTFVAMDEHESVLGGAMLKAVTRGCGVSCAGESRHEATLRPADLDSARIDTPTTSCLVLALPLVPCGHTHAET